MRAASASGRAPRDPRPTLAARRARGRARLDPRASGAQTTTGPVEEVHAGIRAPRPRGPGPFQRLRSVLRSWIRQEVPRRRRAVPLALAAAAGARGALGGARRRSSPPTSRATSSCSTRLERGSLARIGTGPGPGASSASHAGERSSRTRSTASSRSSTPRRRFASSSTASRRRATRRCIPACRSRTSPTPAARRSSLSTPDRAASSLATRVPGPARHVSVSPDGRTLWTALGTTAERVAVLDTRDPRRPRLDRTFAPPFLAHDVVFAPDGHRLGHVRRRRSHRHLPAGRTRARARGRIAHRSTSRSRGEGLRRERRRRHRSPPPSRRRLVRRRRVPVGSYNVTFGWRRVVTPSLAEGTLSLLDGNGACRAVARRARSPRRLHRLRPLKEVTHEEAPRPRSQQRSRAPAPRGGRAEGRPYDRAPQRRPRSRRTERECSLRRADHGSNDRPRSPVPGGQVMAGAAARLLRRPAGRPRRHDRRHLRATGARSSSRPRAAARRRRATTQFALIDTKTLRLSARDAPGLVVRRDLARRVGAVPDRVRGVRAEPLVQGPGVRPRGSPASRAPDRRPRDRREAHAWLGVARRTTADGRWAYTLYARAKNEPFVHALDTARAQAYCIDLPLTLRRRSRCALRLALRRSDARGAPGRATVSPPSTRRPSWCIAS